jgi:hypothetical protein
MGLSQKVKKCVLEFVLANACRSNTDVFRQQMNALECKLVFQTYQPNLKQIYRVYAVSSQSLNVQGFMAFLNVRSVYTLSLL